MSENLKDKLEARLSFNLTETKDKDIQYILDNLCFQPNLHSDTDRLRDIAISFPPTYSLDLNRGVYGREFYFSSPMNQEQNGRMWTLLYVHTFPIETEATGQKRFRVVPTYLSHSHGMWRILPQIRCIASEVFYDKGTSETHITLPLVAQIAISQVIKRTEYFQEVSFTQLSELAPLDKHEEGYWNETDNRGIIIDSLMPDPETLQPHFGYEPNYTAHKGPFRHFTDNYELVDLHGVMSNNGEVLWIFCCGRRKYKGRVWVGNIEHMSPLTSSGVTKEWLIGGDDFITPPIENSRHLSKVGGKEQIEYQESDFCDRLPVVREFKKQVLGL